MTIHNTAQSRDAADAPPLAIGRADGGPSYGRVMTTIGTVRTWFAEQGWGVIDSPDTPGGCWCHFSAVAVAGYRTLTPGHAVQVEWETVVDQDGYRFRTTRAWPAGTEPVDTAPQQTSGAYRSTVTFTFEPRPTGG